jgi:hypothetical protein
MRHCAFFIFQVRDDLVHHAAVSMKKHPVKPNAQNAVIYPRREHARRISSEDDGHELVEGFFKILPERNF